ncbi:MAG: hypothetical protein ACI90V_013144, partial [Bacillariaceae sp.]
ASRKVRVFVNILLSTVVIMSMIITIKRNGMQ